MTKANTNSRSATSTANTGAHLPLISQAIKAALNVGAHTPPELGHSQVLDAVAKELGFKSFRALKALEGAAPVAQALSIKKPLLLKAYELFATAHPAFKLELSVPMRPNEGDNLTPFKFEITPASLEKIVELEAASRKLGNTVEVHIGGLPVGREGTNVDLAVYAPNEVTRWLGFNSVTYHKYDQEVSGSQGDLSLDDLEEALENVAKADLSDLAVGQHLIVNDCTVLYRVDETTLRMACEFTNTEDYLCHGMYPEKDDCITLQGYTEGALAQDCLEGFVAGVIGHEILSSTHHNEG